jgi:hypothetical protein
VPAGLVGAEALPLNDNVTLAIGGNPPLMPLFDVAHASEPKLPALQLLAFASEKLPAVELTERPA